MERTSRRIRAALGLWLWLGAPAGSIWGATFGKVVALGGHVADLALDEGQGVLYLANFTANRVDVMSLDSSAVQTSINVSAQPSSLALSPDGRWLLVAHYGHFEAPQTAANALTLIDLESRAKQTFALPFPPLGVAFGIDNQALVATTSSFFLFDPVTGVSRVLETIEALAARTLPQAPANFPPNIVAASVAASGDGRLVYGLTDTFTFSYDVVRRLLAIRGYTSSPEQGPRVVSVARDGSFFLAGWVLRSPAGVNMAQFPDPAGTLNVGSHAIDSERGRIYAQVPRASQKTAPPVLQILEADNLHVREEIQLPENLAGKSVLSADGSVMYAISDSGVMVLPVSLLERAPRVRSTEEELLFRGNFCDRAVLRREIGIVNLGGGPAGFTLVSNAPGVRVSPATGVAPAAVEVTVDLTAFQNRKGTTPATIEIRSADAVNVPPPIRVLVNNKEPDQRGTVVQVPGKLVDLLADPVRDRFYVLRQDTNEVLVYDGATYGLIARLRTGKTPWQMAITFDRRYLLVGNDNSQIANVFDLETLEATAPIIFPPGHYPRSLAASGRAILAACRVAGPVHVIDRVDLAGRRATALPSLGVYKNDVHINTALVASANGSSILAAQANGTLLLYNANVDSFTIARKDADSLTGAFAASSYDQFVVDNYLLNASLVRVRTFDSSAGKSSGFAFVDQFGLRATAPDATAPGVIQRVDLATGSGIRPTRMTEAPLLGTEGAVFTRTLAPTYVRNAVVALTTSGFTVLPWNYDAAVAMPRIERAVSAADGSPGLAPGGLASIFGRNLSPVNAATRELPLPTALGDSCLTVNGVPMPVLFISPEQITGQIPFSVEGNVTMILRTPGGVSDNYHFTVLPSAASIFRARAGELDAVPVVVRVRNGEVVTLSNPIHRLDSIIIYLTGLGRTTPAVETGVPAPGDPPSLVLEEPVVTLAGVNLSVGFAGLTPGQVGVYQINAEVPGWVPKGLEQPLVITHSGYSTTVPVRVVD